MTIRRFDRCPTAGEFAMNTPFSILLLLALASTAVAQSPFWSASNGPFGGSVIKTVSTRTGTLLAATSHGLFRSTNRGEQWSLTAPALREQEVSALTTTISGAVIAASHVRYLRSTDDGASWTDLSGDDKPFYIASGPGGILFGIVADFDPRLYRSTDDGISWTEVLIPSMTGLDVHVVGSDLVIAHPYAGWMASRDSGVTWSPIPWPMRHVNAIARRRGDTIFIAGLGTVGSHAVARSLDDGETWSDATAGLEGRAVRILHPDGEGRMLAFLADGVARWSDWEQRWENISSFEAGRDDWVFAHQELGTSPDGRTIYAPTARGVFRTLDDGATWSSANDGITAHVTTSIATLIDGDIIAGTEAGIYRSTDLGGSWALTDTTRWTNSIAGTSTGVVFAGGYNGLVRSTDLGSTWHSIREGDSIRIIYGIAAARGGVVAATGVSRSGYFVATSTDDGETWLDVPIEGGNQLGIMRAGPTADLFIATEDKVRRSSDRGVTWRHAVEVDEYVTSVLPLVDGNLVVGSAEGRVMILDSAAGVLERPSPLDTAEIVDLAIDRDARLYVITGAGKAFRRETAGAGDWREISTGIEMTALTRIVEHPSGYMFLATAGGSVQRSVAQVTSVDDHPVRIPRLNLSISER